jgi:hypothetical protein
MDEYGSIGYWWYEGKTEHTSSDSYSNVASSTTNITLSHPESSLGPRSKKPNRLSRVVQDADIRNKDMNTVWPKQNFVVVWLKLSL